jgi:diguanylate cyclase (GGDEF)-like protein
MNFDKTEDNADRYFALNRFLIIFHIALIVYFLILKVYVMALPCAAAVVLYVFGYRLINQSKRDAYFKMVFYGLWLISACLSCGMGQDYGFWMCMLALMLPMALSIYTDNHDLMIERGIFVCKFKKPEKILIPLVTAAVFFVMMIFRRKVNMDIRSMYALEEAVIERVTFCLNACGVVAFIFGYIRLFVTYVEKNEDMLKQKADYDELTGLYNRNRLRFLLDHDFETVNNGGTSFGVAIMDIDDFKKINDNYGHNAGDYVLKHLSGVVENIVKKCEGQIVAGRWGGEEFLVIYLGDNKEDFFMLLEYIRGLVNDADFLYERNRIKVSITIGMALFNGEQSVDDLVNNADMKLYDGKHNGKNQVMA